MKIRLTDRSEVSNFSMPYVIAEIGANHNGDVELAKKLIQAASEAGADCVKFQSWTKNSLISREVYADDVLLKRKQGSTDCTLEQMVEQYSLSERDLRVLKEFSDALGIDWISTPFSRPEADYLVKELGVPFLKAASMDVNNYPFLEYLASLGKPVLLSTGLSRLSEIDRAIQTLEDAGNHQIVLLHCISSYPPSDEQVHLNNLDTLMKLYPYPIGFSDHTIGFSIPLAAAAKGACVIEKHFTLDKNMPGWDHRISADPEELRILCTESKRIHQALGEFRIMPRENPGMQEAFRRSVVLVRPMKKGETVRREDLDFKRPGTGIAPGESSYLIGRALKKDMETDAVLQWADFV